MDEQFCCWKLLIGKTKKIGFFAIFHVFNPHNESNGWSHGDTFRVVGKPIPTFLTAVVHLSNSDNSNGSLTYRQNKAKKRDFI